MAELLTRVNPSKYHTYMSEENGKQVLYVELQKTLYGTLQAMLLFRKDLIHFLMTELGFVINTYDSCVVNKMINGKQCTIIWHVDNLKLSHVEQSVLEELADKLNSKYGQIMLLVIHWGKVHDYLRMTIDYSKDGKVKFSMPTMCKACWMVHLQIWTGLPSLQLPPISLALGKMPTTLMMSAPRSITTSLPSYFISANVHDQISRQLLPS